MHIANGVLWHATLFLHVGDSAVVKLWRFDPAEIMETMMIAVYEKGCLVLGY